MLSDRKHHLTYRKNYSDWSFFLPCSKHLQVCSDFLNSMIKRKRPLCQICWLELATQPRTYSSWQGLLGCSTWPMPLDSWHQVYLPPADNSIGKYLMTSWICVLTKPDNRAGRAAVSLFYKVRQNPSLNHHCHDHVVMKVDNLVSLGEPFFVTISCK